MSLTQQAESLALELRSLGREARSMVSQGRLQELEPIGARTAATFERLQALYPEGRIHDRHVRQIVDEVAVENVATQQLLIALRDELKRAIDETQIAGRAVTSYAKRA